MADFKESYIKIEFTCPYCKRIRLFMLDEVSELKDCEILCTYCERSFPFEQWQGSK